MKKLFIFMGALLLGVGAFGIKGNRAVKTEADGEAAAVATLLTGAMDANKQYTKKTKIFLNKDALADINNHFHAGVASLERATYYDETVGALLMGDYDGGFVNINSGYKNNDGDGSTHFTYKNAASPKTNELFSERNDGWTAAGQKVGGYYQTLTTLASAASLGEWSTFIGSGGFTVYKHTVTSLTVTDGAYGDQVLNAFQYFAAPLLLRDNYVSYDSIWVTQTTSFLSIRLYASSSDEGMSTFDAGENDVLIAEARVYKGLSFSPEAKWYLKGSFDGWVGNLEASYEPDAYHPEQYRVTTTLASKDEIKFTNGTNWYGFSALGAGDRAWLKDNSDNIVIKLSGQHSFYLKPSTSSLEIGALTPDNGTIDLPIDIGVWGSADTADIYAYVWNTESDGHWFASNAAKTNITITGKFVNLILIRQNPAKSSGDWDGVWNKTYDLSFQHLSSLRILNWVTDTPYCTSEWF